MKKKTSWKGLPLSHIGEFHNLDIPLLSRPCSKGTPIQLKVHIVLFISLEITVQMHKVSSGSEKFRVEHDCSLDQFKNCVSHKRESL